MRKNMTRAKLTEIEIERNEQILNKSSIVERRQTLLFLCNKINP
jgi:hypothetical protein